MNTEKFASICLIAILGSVAVWMVFAVMLLITPMTEKEVRQYEKEHGLVHLPETCYRYHYKGVKP